MSGLNMCPTTEHVAGKVSNLLQRPAEEYVNDSEIEMKWATKAFHMAETHYKLITSIRPSLLKLTKHDDEIYKEFRRDFPDLDLKKLPEDDMKTPEGKAKWRPFMNHFQGQVADYNQGCLIRIDYMGEYDQENSMLGTRIQYLAIEIARNRELLNDELYDKIVSEKKKNEDNQ